MSPRATWALIAVVIALLTADAAFSAVTAIIWPGPAALPSWEPRVSSAIWLVALVLAGTGAGSLAWRKWHRR